MISRKRRKSHLYLGASVLFFLFSAGCGEEFIEPETEGAFAAKGDTLTGFVTRTYNSSDPNFGFSASPQLLTIPDRGRTKALKVTFELAASITLDSKKMDLNWRSDGTGKCDSYTDGKKVSVSLSHHGKTFNSEVIAPLKVDFVSYTNTGTGHLTRYCVYSWNMAANTQYSFTVANPADILVNGEWKLNFDQIKSWSLAVDYEPTPTFRLSNTSRINIPDADKNFEVYSAIRVPPLYRGPILAGDRSGIFVDVDISHKDPNDLLIELTHNGKTATLLELMKSEQTQGGLQRRFTIGTTPELSVFGEADVAGEWRLWLVDHNRKYEGNVNSWALELTPQEEN